MTPENCVPGLEKYLQAENCVARIECDGKGRPVSRMYYCDQAGRPKIALEAVRDSRGAYMRYWEKYEYQEGVNRPDLHPEPLIEVTITSYTLPLRGDSKQLSKTTMLASYAEQPDSQAQWPWLPDLVFEVTSKAG